MAEPPMPGQMINCPESQGVHVEALPDGQHTAAVFQTREAPGYSAIALSKSQVVQLVAELLNTAALSARHQTPEPAPISVTALPMLASGHWVQPWAD